MPPTRRRRNKFGSNLSLFLFLCTFVSGALSRSYVGPSHRLQCLTCKTQKEDTTELDQFKVRQSLLEPWCDMEPVECAPQQDTCVTVSMQVGPRSFWIGSGCDQRVNYDIPADRDGCVDLQTFTRTIQYRHVEERPAFQRVCICSDDFCNGSASLKQNVFVLFVSIGFCLMRLRA
ncbi:hypothetical protein M3Y97_01047900 [Aphelenchoides bicaudatus]|nr:hypothetical protein M3Y97_01047900 [Aphelenchoides bicaudatus]